MNPFFATIAPVAPGSSLYVVTPLSGFTPGSPPPRPHPGPTPPGGPSGPPPWGIDVPVDPGYGRPEWGGPVDPGYGIDAGHRPSHPIYIPSPPDVSITPPIYLPDRPQLPSGSGVVVPVPDDVAVPKGGAPGEEPYILWFGPGTVSAVVWLPPVAKPKK
jgi:hypothetical protein